MCASQKVRTLQSCTYIKPSQIKKCQTLVGMLTKLWYFLQIFAFYALVEKKCIVSFKKVVDEKTRGNFENNCHSVNIPTNVRPFFHFQGFSISGQNKSKPNICIPLIMMAVRLQQGELRGYLNLKFALPADISIGGNHRQ